MAGVAHRFGGKIDTHIGAVKPAGGKVSVTRWFYRQRMEAELSRSARPWVLVLDPGNRESFAGAPGNAAVEEVAVILPDAAKRTSVTGTVSPTTGEQTIKPEARLLFVAGAGWTKKQPDGAVHGPEAAKLIAGFLKKSQASLGGSKSIVEAGGEGEPVLPFMTHLNQVGQTGSTPRHPKGLSTCCHGEEPHVVGWRFITERRAVNLDANCGWARGKADVVYVADAFKVMAKVNELLGG
jgi:electron transfer flavoprotein alpha subunit